MIKNEKNNSQNEERFVVLVNLLEEFIEKYADKINFENLEHNTSWKDD